MRFTEFMLAAANVPTPASDPAPAWLDFLKNPIWLFAGAIMLFMLFSGKNKRGDEKQRLDMLKQLKRGDRVQTIGGILGAVVIVEENRVALKTDESNNTKTWFVRSAIAKVLEQSDKGDGKADGKADGKGDKSDKGEKAEAK